LLTDSRFICGKSIRTVLPPYYLNVKELLTGLFKRAYVKPMLPECYGNVTPILKTELQTGSEEIILYIAGIIG
jgi:hypothetical protein